MQSVSVILPMTHVVSEAMNENANNATDLTIVNLEVFSYLIDLEV